MNDNSLIIEKIVTSPESLTPAEILTIRNNEELMELYKTASQLSSAILDIPDFDTDKSLEDMHQQMQNAPRRGHIKRFIAGLSRHAAILAICLSFAAIAVFAIIYFNPIDSKSPSNISISQPSDPDKENENIVLEQKSGKISYDDSTLSDILKDISARYQCKIVYKNEAVDNNHYHLTIPQNASLRDVVDLINAFDEVKLSLNDNIITVE